MMNLQEKIGQMMMVGFAGLEAPPYLLEWLAAGRIGGVILFSRNVESPAQVARLTQQLHQVAKYPILISIDQEGGTVARLRQGFTESPGAMALGAAGSSDLANEVSQMLGAEMRALGINWTLAPVVDVTHDISNPTVGTRSPGKDAALVSQIAVAQVQGFQAAGVAACPKHFPGLGNTPVDTHKALAVISGSVDYLWEHDLIPFRAAIEAGAATVMVSHVKFEALDSQHPATLSPAVTTKLLREEIGFTGMVATDCMEMKAVADHYGAGESAVLAVLAGMDVILFSHTPDMQEAAYQAVLEAVNGGRISLARLNESVARIEAVKNRFAITADPQPEQIRTPEHLAIAEKAARAGMVMLGDPANLLPLNAAQNILVIEFFSYLESEAMERAEPSAFGRLLTQTFPGIAHLALSPTDPKPEMTARAVAGAKQAEIVVLATRSAHLNPSQQTIATQILQGAARSILLCLRNPFDVDVLPAARLVLCTCGDSTPSLQAAVDVLAGKFTPTGQLPVAVGQKT